MAGNYISTNMETGLDVKKALRNINKYNPDSFVWTEVPDTEVIDLKSPTSNSNIKDPGDYSILNYTNGPSEIPEGMNPVLLSLRNGKICVSANGNSYSLLETTVINTCEGIISDTSRNWYSICYGNGKFVTIAYGKNFAYSTDGINWTEGSISNTSRSWYSVCYGNDKFVAIARNSKYFAY